MSAEYPLCSIFTGFADMLNIQQVIATCYCDSTAFDLHCVFFSRERFCWTDAQRYAADIYSSTPTSSMLWKSCMLRLSLMGVNTGRYFSEFHLLWMHTRINDVWITPSTEKGTPISHNFMTTDVTMAPVSGCDILDSKWTFCPETGKMGKRNYLSDFDKGQIVMVRWPGHLQNSLQWSISVKSGPRK